MSIDATRWAWIQQNVSSAQKLVLLSLADRASEDCRCWPSLTRLSHDTCLNKKTVIACISDLIEKGLIRKITETGKHNVYELIGVELRETEIAKKITSPKNGTSTENGTGQKLTSTKNGTAPVPKLGPHQSQKRYPNLKLIDQEPEEKNIYAPVRPADGAAGRQASPGNGKKPYGQFGHVLLTREEYEQLKTKFGIEMCESSIRYLDIYIGAKVGQNDSLAKENHFYTIQLWVLDAVKQKMGQENTASSCSAASTPAEPQRGAPVCREELEQRADRNWNNYVSKLREGRSSAFMPPVSAGSAIREKVAVKVSSCSAASTPVESQRGASVCREELEQRADRNWKNYLSKLREGRSTTFMPPASIQAGVGETGGAWALC